MTTPRIDTYLIVQSGARITADGHLSIRVPLGAWSDIVLVAATYAGFAAAATQLQTQLNAAAIGVVFTVTPADNSVTIAGDGNFELTWEDTELSDYFGFRLSSYTGATSYASDADPTGRITLTFPAEVEYFDLVERQYSTSHAGVIGGYSLARHAGQTMTYFALSDEAAHFASVIRRSLAGLGNLIWIDSTNGNPFDWTAAAWTGPRALTVMEPAEYDLAQWLSTPSALARRLTIDYLECV